MEAWGKLKTIDRLDTVRLNRLLESDLEAAFLEALRGNLPNKPKTYLSPAVDVLCERWNSDKILRVNYGEANRLCSLGSGTDVAKDVASLIVADDNFASIEAGVEEGRFAYDNIRKVTYLLISTGAAEIVLFVLAMFSGMPLPLLPVQLLCGASMRIV